MLSKSVNLLSTRQKRHYELVWIELNSDGQDSYELVWIDLNSDGQDSYAIIPDNFHGSIFSDNFHGSIFYDHSSRNPDSQIKDCV